MSQCFASGVSIFTEITRIANATEFRWMMQKEEGTDVKPL